MRVARDDAAAVIDPHLAPADPVERHRRRVTEGNGRIERSLLLSRCPVPEVRVDARDRSRLRREHRRAVPDREVDALVVARAVRAFGVRQVLLLGGDLEPTDRHHESGQERRMRATHWGLGRGRLRPVPHPRCRRSDRGDRAVRRSRGVRHRGDRDKRRDGRDRDEEPHILTVHASTFNDRSCEAGKGVRSCRSSSRPTTSGEPSRASRTRSSNGIAIFPPSRSWVSARAAI